jgi:glycosyltransferase involved in cell wall biosynthesis
MLNNSRINLCTSIDEAFGLVNIQALGMGVPVIGTNVGGIKDIIKDGWNGYLVEVGDEKALAGKILNLLNDKKLHQSIAKQARHDFEKHYLINHRINKQAKEVIKIFQN